MSLKHFLKKSRLKYDARGVSALPGIAADFTISAVRKMPRVNRFGTNVYEKDWDVLVILDACRTDLYRETINPDAGEIWSVGSSSEEWMDNTFRDVDPSGTAYVTGNVFSRDHLDAADFHRIDEVWEYAWDDDRGTIPPRPLTDRAIDVRRNDDAERMIVHYMQPHFPFIGSEETFSRMYRGKFGEDGEINPKNVWTRLRMNEVSTDELWAAYRDTLEFVFEEVELLMNNVDGLVAVTADHGNAVGEWGIYGHPRGLQVPPVRKVPWDTYECTDSGEYTPDTRERGTVTDDEVQERLEHLGYA
ncbi:hypothetical protein BRD17_02070 [Halobacteriales archaeon SW_7_68_16]|nr:MAG: hypothetical protein BRD17_02070 [Halobacteriales archaeon SW_7_68_16]